ncbi:3-phosphoshikimate 1-carboxyvinyltransferase [Flavobacterium sp.]|uniref:3-phosphoshikimate 1-carboxyvinyltransferase n=1 Tax=Flavobacterium sp. TaxID=239 RepID=UPI002A81BE76|nr:3-phosphoshikimate 1-carboxyvinyltransferase [Flavobacterium sp.]
MNICLQLSKVNKSSTIKITGSKSETNRLLLLQALYKNIKLENSSKSDDSDAMQMALLSGAEIIDIHHAGTAMRFLTAFFAVQEGREVVLTGSSRMKERPIKILVEALQQLGVIITYEENEGFPPIRIKGQKLTQCKVSLPANVSSQYISALLLIAPKLENGLELTLEGEITSIPYIKMTLALLNEIGIETSFEKNIIKVAPKSLISNHDISIESDWSSASYFYSVVALSEIGTQITLSNYKINSIQGDSTLVEIYKDFGVETAFNNDKSITISKTNNCQYSIVNRQLNNCPDIAQTIAVTCFGLGIGCNLTGLDTLKIKETDRLEALKIELTKLGAYVAVTNDSLTLTTSSEINKNISIATYQDHRMAMAFAPLALKVPIIIEDAEVVSKSFPVFWEDLEKIGFKTDGV